MGKGVLPADHMSEVLGDVLQTAGAVLVTQDSWLSPVHFTRSLHPANATKSIETRRWSIAFLLDTLVIDHHHQNNPLPSQIFQAFETGRPPWSKRHAYRRIFAILARGVDAYGSRC